MAGLGWTESGHPQARALYHSQHALSLEPTNESISHNNNYNNDARMALTTQTGARTAIGQRQVELATTTTNSSSQVKLSGQKRWGEEASWRCATSEVAAVGSFSSRDDQAGGQHVAVATGGSRAYPKL